MKQIIRNIYAAMVRQAHHERLVFPLILSLSKGMSMNILSDME